ncbi:MAG: glutamine synthetase [Nocardiopsaceae bacterium]|nr:glutamine synthetase [Nocardiopsaceae bacterium]
MTTTPQGVGQPGFVARHGLLTAEQREKSAEVAERIRAHDLRSVRLAVIDQHGLPRAKNLSPEAAITAMEDGLDFSGAIYSLDTGNNVFVPPFAPGGGFGIDELTGFPDVVLVPDPATFRVLPWADRAGWMLCDAYLGDGQPVPLDGRGLLRRKLAQLAESGYDFVAGLELEFYILKNHEITINPENAGFTPPPPRVSPFERGYQFLSEVRLDSMSETLDAIADALTGLGYPPRSIEDEWGPGQVEISFAPIRGIEGADAAAMIRSAIKQVCQRRGLLATFMCRPGLPDFCPSGWHLHQSLAERANGHNAFADPSAPLSKAGRAYVAGLLEHALAALPFAVPTVNGYKRFRPYSFAPDRACWGLDNRGVLVRVQGAPNDTGSHLELRSGEPAANPYLYLASSIAAGLDGMRRGLKPPPPAEPDPYAAPAPPLPGSLAEAVATLEEDLFYRTDLGDSIVDYLLLMKKSEIERYEASLAEADPADTVNEVTPWEMREYLEPY